MNTPLIALPLAAQIPSPVKKKRVLLVDTSSYNRDLRAEIMRKLGMDVDCAADIAEARCWWRADLYDLVLFDIENGPGHRDRFCQDLRGATPAQRMAFLVGRPEYLADAPRDDQHSPLQSADDQVVTGDVKAALSPDLRNPGHPWGILEASRRISKVRSVCSARTRAMRDRPAPPRDSDARASKYASAASILDNLFREETQ
jgi:CheY-like chemotaxis protein